MRNRCEGKIFISYRRASNQWAVERLFEVLADTFGAEDVFLDRVTIEPGAGLVGHVWTARCRRPRRWCWCIRREWAGDQADGSRRIDRADDMVRRELITANRHGRPIFPVIIDDRRAARVGQMPEGLSFVLKRQFLKLVPATADFAAQSHQLTRAIAGAQPGAAWGRRFLWQVTWIALTTSALVAAWHALGGSSTFDNAFARSAITLRTVLGVDDGSSGSTAWADDVAMVEINDLDFQSVLGGTRRYDPALASILLNALTNASRQGKACRPDAPLALNFDLAPDPDRYDKTAFEALENSLADLAQCRPTVLACPRSVALNLSPTEDMKWMARLLARVPQGLLFTQAPLDPRGLRHSLARTEPGVVLADLARDNANTTQRLQTLQREGCLCPPPLKPWQPAAPPLHPRPMTTKNWPCLLKAGPCRWPMPCPTWPNWPAGASCSSAKRMARGRCMPCPAVTTAAPTWHPTP